MADMTSPVIEAKALVKAYGKTPVLKGINLVVKGPVIFGLLGPNGAGKTTFVKSLLNLTAIGSGSLSLLGLPVSNEKCRQDLAFLPEKFSFFPYYTVEGTLAFFGRMYGLTKGDLERAIGDSMKKLGLTTLARQKLRTLSKGQLQRVGLCKLLISNANLLIMDEPFSGLDPIGIKEMKDLLLELRAKGKTIFLNSHLLSEVEQICEEVAILREGEILAQGNLKKLIGNSGLEDFFYRIVKGRENS